MGSLQFAQDIVQEAYKVLKCPFCQLYGVEVMATEQKMYAQQRAELRQRLAYPILCTFEKWIVNYYPGTLPKRMMNKALSYTYSLYQSGIIQKNPIRTGIFLKFPGIIREYF